MDFEIKFKNDQKSLTKQLIQTSLKFYTYLPYSNFTYQQIQDVIKNLKPNKNTSLVDCLVKLKWPNPICVNLVRWAKELTFTIYKGFKSIDDAEKGALEFLMLFTLENSNDQLNNIREKLLMGLIQTNFKPVNLTENNLILFLYNIFKSIQGFVCTNVIFFSFLPEIELIDFSITENISALFKKYIVDEDSFEDKDQDEFYINGYKELIEKKTNSKVFFSILKRFLEHFYNKKFPKNFEFDEGNLEDFITTYHENDSQILFNDINLTKVFEVIPEFCSPFKMIFTIVSGESYLQCKDKELKGII
jgi:hypothetical protein